MRLAPGASPSSPDAIELATGQRPRSSRSYVSTSSRQKKLRRDYIYREGAEYAKQRDDYIWSSIEDIHKDGLFGLGSARPWYTPKWVTRLWVAWTMPEKDLESGVSYGYRVNFADVHRAHLRYLQVKLVDMTADLQFYDRQKESPWHHSAMADELGQTMKDYIQGVRDLEYMAKYSLQVNDPFIASSERLHDNRYLGKALRDRPTFKEHLRRMMAADAAKPTGPWETGKGGVAEPIAGRRGQSYRRAFGSRLRAATNGGVFIIIPMWVLSLKTDIMFQLGFTTGCVVLFGGLMSWHLSTLSEVFQATLAYAAVLMVFIGVMLQTSATPT